MKKQPVKTNRISTNVQCQCSRSHRVWSAVALVGLFMCGLMIGLPMGARHGATQSMRDNVSATNAANMPTCARIEQLLSDRLEGENTTNPDVFMYNANIYATMVEYGCPENAEKYRDQALADLAIANALSYNGLASDTDNTEVVIDTYKKLEMQTQARDFLNKVQKLTDPAIDFILQMEKIINE